MAQPAIPLLQEFEDTRKLFEELDNIDRTPNIITRLEFKKFEPLFRRNHSLNEASIKALTEDYRKRVDLYKETLIVDNIKSKNIILRLPAVLTQIRSLSPTQRNSELVGINNKLGSSSIPLHASSAFGNMFQAVMAEQQHNKTAVSEARDQFNKTQQEFVATYNKHSVPSPVAGKKNTIATPVVVSKIMDDSEWSMED